MKKELPENQAEEAVGCVQQAGKTKRFLHKIDKFRDYEDRLNNHQVIDYMIKVRPAHAG